MENSVLNKNDIPVIFFIVKVNQVWTFKKGSNESLQMLIEWYESVISDIPYLLWIFGHLCWGFTAQSTQWGHVEHGQFT